MIGTSFVDVYDSFLSKTTADMYMELDELQTYGLLQDLLVSAIPWFEFPRQDIADYDLLDEREDWYCGVDSNLMEVTVLLHEGGCFNCELTSEEIDILSTYMVVEWIGQQLASIENIRMKYSGGD